ncbi:hypothetical protein NEOLEDRAFT_1170601 [Neolentinus lepideus HHB14362 ss-1]|uniref:Uncharacterized protein n=1 Tax=Neolentinus lepideus HHB14362 ss-1 TaxID=1314782 RepID=A0A165RDL0_9AGAM|nr:hypothetical protein NEOLEDRAFT_1170601 [Neolentinus lepideus HHB14362 ss-1]
MTTKGYRSVDMGLSSRTRVESEHGSQGAGDGTTSGGSDIRKQTICARMSTPDIMGTAGEGDRCEMRKNRPNIHAASPLPRHSVAPTIMHKKPAPLEQKFEMCKIASCPSGEPVFPWQEAHLERAAVVFEEWGMKSVTCQRRLEMVERNRGVGHYTSSRRHHAHNARKRRAMK